MVWQREAERLRALLRHDESAGVFRRIERGLFRAQRFLPLHPRGVEAARPGDGTVARQILGCDPLTEIVHPAASMKIVRIFAHRVELPLRETTYKWSGGKSMTVFDSTIVG